MSYEIGYHEARPVSYQFGQSREKKTEMVSILFQFVGGPNDGKKITYDGYFADTTAKRTMDSLEYCGWDGVELSTPLAGFGTKNVSLDIQNEKGQDGKEYPRVAWVNKLLTRGPATVYDATQVKSLAERMAAVNAERRRENAEKNGTSVAADPFGNG